MKWIRDWYLRKGKPMLIPAKITRFNVDPEHPFYVPEIEEKIANSEVIVMLDNRPVANLLGFDVANGYVKRVASDSELQTVAKTMDENAYSRACREGIRIKGKVAVFINR